MIDILRGVFGELVFDNKLQSNQLISELLNVDNFYSDEEIQLNIEGKFTQVNITPLI